ncbi:hypothetical protein BV25DRAFT_1995309 [Artomyces pyxidatus]|uniref:Uncharacterized protein n=1 Tax=Artomyces pyxidatus TaxID=48021 RepID=A0ACB8SKW4_9AGAM|nr:hypothetical protein BV25DRAFT_1995309 [Artomyces pyxidatus]
MEKRAFPKDDAPAAKRPRLSAPDGFAKSKAPPHSKIPAPVFVSAFSTADTSAKPVSTSSTSAFKPRALPAVSVTSAKPKSAPAREYRQLAVPPRPERDVQTPSSSKLTLPVPPPPPPAIVSRKNTASAPAPTIPAKPITARPVFAAPPPSTPPKRRTVRTPFDFKTTPHTPTSASAKVLKTISTTRFARSTDISREDGTLEVLGLFLQQNGVEHTSAADREVARGLEVTPQKPGVGARYMCGGLAELAHRTLSRDEMSLSLWAKEMETRSAHARPPAPEVYFRVQRVLLPRRQRGARALFCWRR